MANVNTIKSSWKVAVVPEEAAWPATPPPAPSTALRTEVARTDTLAQRDFQLITMQIFGSKMRKEREGAA